MSLGSRRNAPSHPARRWRWRPALSAPWLLAAAGAVAQAPIATQSAPPSSARVVPVSAADILHQISAAHGKAVVVNIWATWCQPCVDEFPDLLRLRRDYHERGLELLLVSADFDTELPQVHAFLERQQVDFPTYFKNEKDQEFINTLSPEWSGALPATFLYDQEGKLREFWQGQFSYARLEQQIRTILDSGT